jgi:hypothetical protein
MVIRRLAQPAFAFWSFSAIAMSLSSLACSTVGDSTHRLAWSTKPPEQIRLSDAEHLVDEIDRTITAMGTISVKTPDVWGQDRLAKFRSEYESQMAEWRRTGFKADINASVSRAESQSTQAQVGATLARPATKTSSQTFTQEEASAETMSKSMTAMNAGNAVVPPSVTDKGAPSLEPMVVLDEHSSYLNHLNQLRRVNAGDELTDRPGYGLYLVRIPVTLSPGPRSRSGKGAMITVSAKMVVTKSTLTNALRNTVINETVINLTQALRNHEPADDDLSTNRGVGSYSFVSFADTELFYGRPNIDLLAMEADNQLGRELDSEPHHRTARIADWLRQELEACYPFLAERATPKSTTTTAARTDPLEELGNLVARRDFTRIAMLRGNNPTDDQVSLAAGGAPAQSDGMMADTSRRRQTTSLLSFALEIQAAGISRRLKADMVDQDPKLEAEKLQGKSFFEPHVTDEAFEAFERYVQAKWPLRVYAIEPVIAQQNVADAFAKSKRTTLDLFGVAPLGLWNAVAGLAADQRAADNETAIRLNPTMVGFGAGQSTFGWVFYPRVQTGGANSGRLFTNLSLLLSGHFADMLGGDQSIEPGQRECTALIELPNFVPKIEFVTVASWFGTAGIGDGQKADLEQASDLGRKLVTAEAAFQTVKAQIDGQYRREDYEILGDRIEQLRDMMPTQRLVVRVPFSGDHNDSRIFCSQGLQLRPSIIGWHGRPPELGQESTIFVEGRNFSVHDTHVIAGGKVAKSVLVSRNLLEVTIGKDAEATNSADGDPLLDVTVATPNGVSNHLLIKMSEQPFHLRRVVADKPTKEEKVSR